MEKKRIKIDLCLELSPHIFMYMLPGISKTGSEDLEIRLNFFFGEDRYYSFYSGLLWKKRAIKRVTWVYELLYHRDERKKSLDKEYSPKPIKILVGVVKGDYEYRKTTISPYLMRRLISSSTRPLLNPYE